MTSLNEKVVEILKHHPEGKPFFDALDAMIRGDLDILRTFLTSVLSDIDNAKQYTLVLTGRFGNALMSRYGHLLYDEFDNVILVEGGLQNGKIPAIFNTEIERPTCIMLDDSYYSGTTKKSIETALKVVNSDATIRKVYVVYDGSITKPYNVWSMFRYHNDNDPKIEEFPDLVDLE